MKAFKVGDRVRLTPDYTGYFAAFKNQVLTVAAVHPKCSATDHPSLSIVEFKEAHSIYVTHFEAVATSSEASREA